MMLSPVDPSVRVAASSRVPGPSVPTTAPAATGTVIPYNAPTEGDFAKVLQSLAPPVPTPAPTVIAPPTAGAVTPSTSQAGATATATAGQSAGQAFNPYYTVPGTAAAPQTYNPYSAAAGGTTATSQANGPYYLGAGATPATQAYGPYGVASAGVLGQTPGQGMVMGYMLVPMLMLPVAQPASTSGTAGIYGTTAPGSAQALVPAGIATGSLNPPFAGNYPVTQNFGPTSFSAEPAYQGYAHFHTGTDYGLPLDTQIDAAGAGRVVAAGWTDSGFGNEVMIDHGNGVTTLYGHLDKVQVKVGDGVQAGQAIGLSGSTGNSTGPHLHFGVEVNGTWVDPTTYQAGSQAPLSSSATLAQPTPTATFGTLAAPAMGTGLSAGQGSYALPALPALQGYAMQAVPAMYTASATGISGVSGTQPVSSLSGLGGVQSSTAVGTVGTSSLNGMIQQAAAASGVSASLIAAVVQAESGGDANAVSGSGAKGLMQLMDGTAAAYGVTNSFDPQQNLMGGSRFLRSMLDQFGGNAQLALAAYNAGPAAVTRYGGVPPYGETQSYVQKVLAMAQQNSIG